jgi:hypothetical protein
VRPGCDEIAEAPRVRIAKQTNAGRISSPSVISSNFLRVARLNNLARHGDARPSLLKLVLFQAFFGRYLALGSVRFAARSAFNGFQLGLCRLLSGSCWI